MALLLFPLPARAACTGSPHAWQVFALTGGSAVYCADGDNWTTLPMGSAAAAGSTGEVQFNGGSNAFAADAGLFWDNTNKRLGIGTSTPGWPLDIEATGTTFLRISSGGTNLMTVTASGGGNGIVNIMNSAGTSTIRLSASSGQTNYINAGSLGVGTSSPNANAVLDVASTTQGFLLPRMTTVQANTLDGLTSTNGMLVFDTDTGTVKVQSGGAFTSLLTGSGTANSTTFLRGDGTWSNTLTGAFTASTSITTATYYHSSDSRLKANVRTFAGGLDMVARLRGVSFDWKATGAPSSGVIAQEVESVLPSAVATGPDGMKSVAYDELLAPLIEAVKELKADNDNLRASLDELRRMVEAR
ncbi:MAG: tail fiber domain-containing protein [Bauldia sp.]|nr:tail fiber domain-containing protein [Bauldia sp.]MCW5716901.1 tail fiber domain-containing protein [Bauldia sp.]